MDIYGNVYGENFIVALTEYDCITIIEAITDHGLVGVGEEGAYCHELQFRHTLKAEVQAKVAVGVALWSRRELEIIYDTLGAVDEPTSLSTSAMWANLVVPIRGAFTQFPRRPLGVPPDTS